MDVVQKNFENFYNELYDFANLLDGEKQEQAKLIIDRYKAHFNKRIYGGFTKEGALRKLEEVSVLDDYGVAVVDLTDAEEIVKNLAFTKEEFTD